VFSKMMFLAGVGGKDCKGPQEIMARIMLGLELGLPPMTAIRELFVIDGRCGMSARLMHTLARRSGARVRFIEISDRICTVGITPSGEEQESKFTWTIEMAAKAQLAGRRNWQTYPQQLLMSRAVSMAVNYACPEVLGGGMYEADELSDLREVEGEEGAKPTAKARTDARMAEFETVFGKKSAAEEALEVKASKGERAAAPQEAAAPSDEPAPAKPPRKSKPEPQPTKLENGSQALAKALSDAAMKAKALLLGGQIEIDAAIGGRVGLEPGVYSVITLCDMVNSHEILNALRDAGVEAE